LAAHNRDGIGTRAPQQSQTYLPVAATDGSIFEARGSGCRSAIEDQREFPPRPGLFITCSRRSSSGMIDRWRWPDARGQAARRW